MNNNTFDDKTYICAFTGHRPECLPFSEPEVRAWLEKEIRLAIDKGFSTFISGMQRGVDLWAAETVLRLRDVGENIRLVAAVPFRGMESRWDADWKNRYDQVLQKADQVTVISSGPGRVAFFLRNHYMVDRASRLLAVCGGGGGTLETMNYAKKKGVEVIEYSAVNTADPSSLC